MAKTVQRLSFDGALGAKLAARLDIPPGQVKAYALFAHCFTCSKDIFAARRIASALARQGIAVLRFDFTGLGASEGEFASTNFSSNIGDLLRAVDYLRENYQAPAILIGHSLGGAAVLAAAPDVPEAKAVATIGAPADAVHVAHNFHAHVDEISDTGEAEVTLGGRQFTIRQQFLDDLAEHKVKERIGNMKKALMVLHSPIDQTVGIDNAGDIFAAARHPKSFVSLDTADHLLSDPDDAAYAADVISAWAGRFVGAGSTEGDSAAGQGIMVSETGEGKFQNTVASGPHRLFADEPKSVGGLDTGPSPYDYVAIGLAACTSMTLRMYANFKKIDLPRVTVEVEHGKVHAADCEDCAEELRQGPGKIDRFERRITIDGDIDDALRAKVLEIADKCPVHRTLENGAAVVTKMVEE